MTGDLEVPRQGATSDRSPLESMALGPARFILERVKVGCGRKMKYDRLETLVSCDIPARRKHELHGEVREAPFLSGRLPSKTGTGPWPASRPSSECTSLGKQQGFRLLLEGSRGSPWSPPHHTYFNTPASGPGESGPRARQCPRTAEQAGWRSEGGEQAGGPVRTLIPPGAEQPPVAEPPGSVGERSWIF